MKTAKLLSRILALGFGIAALAMFFLNIVTVVSSMGTFHLTGAQLAFGSGLKTTAGTTINLYRSAYYTFAFIAVALTAMFSVLSFKWKGCRVASLVTGIVSAILMLMFAFSSVAAYVDSRPIRGITSQSYQMFFYLCLAFAIAFIVFTIIAILVADYLEVLESKGAKKTIIKRIVAFLREYKSEIKKIAWPNFNSVVRNTIIVLIMCVCVGAFIWLLDYGLGQLLKVILKLN